MSVGKLPEGWVETQLDEILLLIVGGGTPSKANPEYYQGEIPWMSVKDMNKHTLTDTMDHITPEAVKNSSTNIIPAGTPIIATRMSLGKIVTASFDSAINQDLKALFLSSGTDRNFFLHWYRSQAQLIESLGTGTTVKGIRLEVLKALTIFLPPLAEQKIIAEKLDTLLAQVDSTKARLEKIPQILKRFRQAVLAAATSGFLTNELTSRELPYNWRVVKLIDVIKNKPRNGYSPKGVDYVTDIKNLTLSAITKGFFLGEHFKYVDIDISHDSHLWLKNEDFLIQRANSLEYVGISALYEGEDNKFIYPDLMMKFRANEKIIPKYLEYSLHSEKMRKYFRNNATGTAGNMPKINQTTVSEAPVNLPPLPEQHEIVRRVEQLFAYADTIEKQVNAALARVNNLTQSILAKAFRGELTAHWRAENPALISGENSAAALLEKIKAERAASTGKKASRKKA
ncbi:restriction endonuclease subunit S [Kosakonia radicincitans]|uniref:restriction endonuclease subunit S n=1 Tax=Kosakonia radicincitans TaxID=283686 RepID=UPI0008C5FD9F|nr:restriction endonuclease subunit S [Kosakonia radicincitans]SET46369.1 type I restriction enzyme, S subunit [Kosakonia radicincitans]